MLPAVADQNLTMDRLTHYAGSAEAVAGGTTHGIMGQVAALPYAPDTPQWSQAVKQIITSQAAPAGSETAIGQVAGVPTTQTTANAIIPGVTAPAVAGGGFTPTPGTPIGVSPGQRAGFVPGPVGPHGEQTSVPLGSLVDQNGNPIDMGPGRYQVPPALRNPNSPNAGTGMPGQITTGLGPGQQSALTATGSQATQGFGQVAENGNRAVQQNAMLSNMQADLAQFTSGTGAEKTLDFKRAIQSWAPGIASAIGIDPKNVAAQESFDKLAAQIADAQGAGSDHRLDVTQAANPHSGLSAPGADLIIRQLQGNTDYLKALQQQAAKYPDQTDYRGFSSQMASALDPRYFQLNRMTPQQQRDYLAAMPAAEKTQFKTGYIQARNNGFLNAGQ
jgi:hypothetical protein